MKAMTSHFIERWAHNETLNIRLGLCVIVLGIMTLVLSIGLVCLALHPKPVYYITESLQTGIAKPNTDTKSLAIVFASAWILNWANYTPATIESMYQRCQKFMSPSLLAKTQSRLNNDVQEVLKNSISSFFTPSADTEVKNTPYGLSILIKGEKGVYFGKEQMSRQTITYTLLLKKTAVTEENPYGLYVESISQEEQE